MLNMGGEDEGAAFTSASCVWNIRNTIRALNRDVRSEHVSHSLSPLTLCKIVTFDPETPTIALFSLCLILQPILSHLFSDSSTHSQNSNSSPIMAPLLPWVEDMGMHLPLHQKLFDRSYTHHRRVTGPIARRTRSRTLKAPPNTPQPAPEARPARSGRFKPNPKFHSATALKKASHKIHTTRLKLARSIDSERDDSGRLKPSLREKYHQLGLEGALSQLSLTLGQHHETAKRECIEKRISTGIPRLSLK